MTVKEKFPGITRAALTIAYYNSGINRERSEADFFEELEKFLMGRCQASHAGLRTILFSHLISVDRWLQTQSDEMLDTVCNGERGEALAGMDGAPEGTDTLLNDVCENVC